MSQKVARTRTSERPQRGTALLTPERVIRHARTLVALARPGEILVRTCAEALRVTGGSAAFGCYTPPRESWDQGVHVHVRRPGEVADLTPPTVSALFAIHRRVALRQEPVVLGAGEDGVVVDALSSCAGEPVGAVLAVPLRSRAGRLVGEISVALPAPGEVEPELVEVLRQLAALGMTALEGAQHLAFARRDQERLHLLAEASDEALWDWHLDTQEFWWGGSARTLLGDAGQVQNRPEWKLLRIHPDDRARVRESLERAIASVSDSAWGAEYRVERADGSVLHVEDRGFLLRASDGRAFRVVGAMRDVTPLKSLLEREQKARAAAETANRAKDDFLAMLGHELRNPLAPILAAVDVLRQRGVPEIERECTVIERQTQHLVRLVDDLLDVSRAATGKIELHKERLELWEVVAKAVEMTRTDVQERGHRLTVRVPKSGLRIEADPARLAQVLCNLLTNAAKYTEKGGRITLEARRSGEVVYIEVSDDGIGIAPYMLPRVFDMFVQGRQSLDRSRGGLGLGLSIVRSLVSLHGGTVEAHSAGPGQGSRFTIRIPLATESPLDRASAGGEGAPGEPEREEGLRILIVDDNHDAVDMLTLYLRHVGNTTATAYDGPAALRAVEEFRPEVVLLDVGLPLMNGYEVARHLRRQPGGDRLRLVAVTGYGQESDRRRALEAGFDAHLVKPVRMKELHGLIENLTRSE